MDKRQLIIVGGIIVLGLVLAFPLTWIFTESGAPRPSAISPSAVRQTDGRGTEWAITPVGGRPVVADANATEAKPVVVVKTDVARAGERQMLIGLVLEGRDGQRYRPTVTKGGVPLPAPKLRIVNEAGEVLLDDSFKYG
jgi:hypothetical protein